MRASLNSEAAAIFPNPSPHSRRNQRREFRPLRIAAFRAVLNRTNELGVRVAHLRVLRALVQQQVERIQFGVVQIVIHESRVVRIERTEKLLVPEEERQETSEGRKS